MRNRFLSFLLLSSCASVPTGPYLFPRGKQQHEVSVYSADGKENFKTNSFLLLSESNVKLTALTPVALTLLKMEMQKDGEAQLTYINPVVAAQKENLVLLLKKLGKLLWLRGKVPSDIKVLSRATDGSARELEWNIASQRIVIKVKAL